ncbi:MAG TPA: phospholipid carrier-dependent glycosyltransferase [Chloroflexia bacterium]|nr:phospholipid carrier-dependent glycosyltransferase [Chloroflexia bacterium]
MSQRDSRLAAQLAPPALLVGLSAALFAYLLARFPYNGLYGQDAYAYYYQAEALWHELTGQPQPPYALFTASGLFWPVGYHLHLFPSFLLGWPDAGRVLTLALAALTPAVVYLLAGEVWQSAGAVPRVVAGLVAGAVLLLTGTYVRTGLSQMSDVPAVFWGTLGVYFSLRAWPPGVEPGVRRSKWRWALAAGAALGVAVLVRYSSALLLPALVSYLAARGYMQGREPLSSQEEPPRAWWRSSLAWAAVGLVLALLPQIAYLLAHEPGPALRGWSPGNIFSSTVTGSDGTASFSTPMIAFYLLSTLANVGGGFLSPFYLPALLAGVWTLIRQGNAPATILLFFWWFIGVLAYSGTLYQAHRFALTFMPVLAILIGIGMGAAFFSLQIGAQDWRDRPSDQHLVRGLLSALLLLGLGVGLWQGERSAEQWVATHAEFNAQEQQVVALAREAAVASGQEGAPRVVCFGFSAPLYHYTRWPILDFFAHDEADIEGFLAAPGPHILVLPEESMSTQWAGTPSGARWEWIKSSYRLTKQGQAGVFTVYVIEGRRASQGVPSSNPSSSDASGAPTTPANCIASRNSFDAMKPRACSTVPNSSITSRSLRSPATWKRR